jgi:hypothetical protein
MSYLKRDDRVLRSPCSPALSCHIGLRTCCTMNAATRGASPRRPAVSGLCPRRLHRARGYPRARSWGDHSSRQAEIQSVRRWTGSCGAVTPPHQRSEWTRWTGPAAAPVDFGTVAVSGMTSSSGTGCYRATRKGPSRYASRSVTTMSRLPCLSRRCWDLSETAPMSRKYS